MRSMSVKLNLRDELLKTIQMDSAAGDVVIKGNKVIESNLFPIGGLHNQNSTENSTLERDYSYQISKRGKHYITIDGKEYLINPRWWQSEMLRCWNQKRWIYEKDFVMRGLFLVIGSILGYIIKMLTSIQ